MIGVESTHAKISGPALPASDGLQVCSCSALGAVGAGGRVCLGRTAEMSKAPISCMRWNARNTRVGLRLTLSRAPVGNEKRRHGAATLYTNDQTPISPLHAKLRTSIPNLGIPPRKASRSAVRGGVHSQTLTRPVTIIAHRSRGLCESCHLLLSASLSLPTGDFCFSNVERQSLI